MSFRQFLNAYRYSLASIFALGILFVLPSEGIDIPMCPFLIVTEIPCPICGLTRSMSSLLHLEFAKSLAFHPLGGFTLAFLSVTAVTNRSFKMVCMKLQWSRFFNVKWLIAVVVFIWIVRVFVWPWLTVPLG